MAIKISLVAPIRNEIQMIDPFLKSILSQTRAPDEIVLTDGGSVDGTIEVIEGYIQKGFPIRLICNHNAYPGRAFNLAIAAAKGPYIASTGCGIVIDDRWLEMLENRLKEDSNLDVVFGDYTPIIDTSFKKAFFITSFYPTNRIEYGKLRYTDSNASMLMRKSVWDAIGGYCEDLRFGSDTIFLRKARSMGFRIGHTTNSLVSWQIRERYKELCFVSRYGTLSALQAKCFRDIQHRLAAVLIAVVLIGAGISFPSLLHIAIGLLALVYFIRGGRKLWLFRHTGLYQGFAQIISFYARILIMISLSDFSVVYGIKDYFTRKLSNYNRK